MQGNASKDASAQFQLSHPDAQKFGWETMKSPRNIIFLSFAAFLFAASSLTCPAHLSAQEPPSAPTPKVPRDLPAQAPANSQEAQPATTQNPSDSQTTLKFNVNYVFLPVTVKDGDGHLVADLEKLRAERRGA